MKTAQVNTKTTSKTIITTQIISRPRKKQKLPALFHWITLNNALDYQTNGYIGPLKKVTVRSRHLYTAT